MKAVVRLSDSSYENGDVIAIVDDSHVFSEADLPAGERGIIDVGILTEEEKVLLLIPDPDNNRRRKYQLNISNKPELKP